MRNREEDSRTLRNHLPPPPPHLLSLEVHAEFVRNIVIVGKKRKRNSHPDGGAAEMRMGQYHHHHRVLPMPTEGTFIRQRMI